MHMNEFAFLTSIDWWVTTLYTAFLTALLTNAGIALIDNYMNNKIKADSEKELLSDEIDTGFENKK